MTPTLLRQDVAKRIARHFIRRVEHAAAAEVMASALENDLLKALPLKLDGISFLRFVLSPSASGKSDAELLGMLSDLEQLGLGLGQRHRFIYDQGEIVVDEGFVATRLKYSGAKEIEVKANTPPGNEQSPAVEAGRSPTSLLKLIRTRAVRLPAGDVAAMLLLAEGIGKLDLPLADILTILKRPRAITTIFCDVNGFENRLLDLLKRGLILPGEAVVTQVGQANSRSEIRQAAKRGVRRHVIAVVGSLYGADTHDIAIADAARGLLPLLCVSEFKGGIPKQLRAVANLEMTCPSLTPELVLEVIEIVSGHAPSRSLADVDFSMIGLDDFALAVGPGNTADEAADLIVELSRSRVRPSMHDNGAAKPTATKSGSELVPPAASDVARLPLLKEMSGYPRTLLDWSNDLELDLALWRQGNLPWDEVGATLLLSGPPGTGKTVFAQVLANTLSVPLIKTSVSIWLQPSHLGAVLKRMRDVFTEAATHAPAVLFIDEIDGIGSRASSEKAYADYWNSVVNNLLELLNASWRAEGVIVVGATNRPDNIDPALRRAGRLQPHIEIGLPDTKALAGIFRQYLGSDLASVAATAPMAFKHSA